ncbi:MAG: two-component regulator propeller domain-containing protein, partial [Bacteroidota bacterium]
MIIGLCWCLALHPQSHIFYENGHEVTSFMLPERFVSQTTDQIWKDKDGQLWFLKVGQLFRYDGASFEPISFHHQGVVHSLSSGRQYNRIFRDQKRNIWLSRMGDGIERYDLKSGILQKLQVDSLNKMGRITNSFVEDNEGNIWVGAEWGILKINDGNLD